MLGVRPDGKKGREKEEWAKISKITKKAATLETQRNIKLPGNFSAERGGDRSPEVTVLSRGFI